MAIRYTTIFRTNSNRHRVNSIPELELELIFESQLELILLELELILLELILLELLT